MNTPTEIISDEERNETWALAGLLRGRYGRLALTRAAGEAAAAERTGDKVRSAIYYNVIAHLRQTMTAVPTNGTA